MTTGESGCFPRSRARSRLKGRDPYRVSGVHSMYAAHQRIKRFAFAPERVARLGKVFILSSSLASVLRHARWINLPSGSFDAIHDIRHVMPLYRLCAGSALSGQRKCGPVEFECVQPIAGRTRVHPCINQ